MPFVQAGLLSNRTALEQANYNYDVELERKKDEEPDAYLFEVKPTFAQKTVNPETQESTTKTSPQGRTPEGQNPIDDVPMDEEEVEASAKFFRKCGL
jgi:hypothetical protein